MMIADAQMSVLHDAYRKWAYNRPGRTYHPMFRKGDNVIYVFDNRRDEIKHRFTDAEDANDFIMNEAARDTRLDRKRDNIQIVDSGSVECF